MSNQDQLRSIFLQSATIWTDLGNLASSIERYFALEGQVITAYNAVKNAEHSAKHAHDLISQLVA